MKRPLAEQARAIWQAAVDVVLPEPLVVRALSALADPVLAAVRAAPRVVVVGAGKAGAAMAAGVEAAFADRLDRVDGWVNVPEGTDRPLKRIRLHAARPAGGNQPTAEGVAGTEAMLRLLASAGPDDVRAVPAFRRRLGPPARPRRGHHAGGQAGGDAAAAPLAARPSTR